MSDWVGAALPRPSTLPHPGLDSVLATLGNSVTPPKESPLVAAPWPPTAGWQAGGWAGRQNITPKINEEDFQPLLDYSFY